jgi:16S rRNA (guanine527-N7)-methyltransferase
MTTHETLVSGLDMLGISYSGYQLGALTFHIEEIERWNRRFNLVKATGQDLAIKHTLDSLAGLPGIRAIPQRNTILDIGSGAGFPGVPLAIFLPDSKFTLAESLNKRAVFLSNISILLKLGNTKIVSADYSTIQSQFDVITFRAFAELPGEIEKIAKKLAGGGSIAAYKGKKSNAESEAKEISDIGYKTTIVPVNVPYLNEERHMVFVTKTS